MKLVFFGYDFMIDAVTRLHDDGHEFACFFSFPTDNIFMFNHRMESFAAEHNIPFVTERPTSGDIEKLIAEGCHLFVSAGYPHKIPPIDEAKAYGINLHPTLLPQGRGIMPTPYLILHHPEAAGVTVHKLTPQFDQGDILFQEPLRLNEEEDVESYSARIMMRAPDILSDVVADIETYWKNAKPQAGKGSHWPPPDMTMNTLDWEKSVAELNRTGRAFGRYGCIARFDDKVWLVRQFSGWPESHERKHKPGDVAVRLANEVVVTASDGYICLKDFFEIQETG